MTVCGGYEIEICTYVRQEGESGMVGVLRGESGRVGVVRGESGRVGVVRGEW